MQQEDNISKDDEVDRNIEFHKNADMYAEEFDKLCYEGKLNLIEPLLDKFPGIPINGFCYICMLGNKELAERLWNMFKHGSEEMYALCCIQHIYTEILIKNKMNVADWIYQILQDNKNIEHLRNILEYTMYYVFYYSNLSICEIVISKLITEYNLSSASLKNEEEGFDEKHVTHVRNIINNCFLFACRNNKVHNAQYLINNRLIAKETINKYISLYPNKNFENISNLISYECNYMDIDIKKIPHIPYP